MITEDYVSFKTAKLLKEKGFDVQCRCFMSMSQGFKTYCSDSFNYNNKLEFGRVSCPTLQLVMKWLREVHHIGIESLIVFNDENDGRPQFMCQYWSLVPPFDLKVDEAIESRCFDTYEESIETAIKYCLENLI